MIKLLIFLQQILLLEYLLLFDHPLKIFQGKVYQVYQAHQAHRVKNYKAIP